MDQELRVLRLKRVIEIQQEIFDMSLECHPSPLLGWLATPFRSTKPSRPNHNSINLIAESVILLI